MLTEKDLCRLAMHEANDSVLPIPDMVAPTNPQHLVAEIVTIEEMVESVNNAVTLVNNDHHHRRVATTCDWVLAGQAFSQPRSSRSSLAILTRLGSGRLIVLTSEPVWSVLDVIVTGEKHPMLEAEIIELVEVGQVVTLPRCFNWVRAEKRFDML